MKKTLQEFIEFVKTPEDTRCECPDSHKVRTILLLLLVHFTCSVFLSLPFLYLLHKYYPIQYNPISYSTNNRFDDVLGMAILAPIIEEYIFRYPLRYNNFLSKLISTENWNKYFKYFVYTSATCFGIVHFTNYIFSHWTLLFFIPILTFSQIIGGMTLAYSRVKFGMKYAILQHSLWNLSLLIIVTLIYTFFNSPFKLENNNLSLSVSTHQYHEKKKQVFNMNLKGDSIYNLTVKQYSLQHAVDSIFGKDAYIVDDEIVDMTLITQKRALSKNELITTLRDSADFTIHRIKK